MRQDQGVLYVIDARASNVVHDPKAPNLGSIGSNWTSPPQWSPDFGRTACIWRGQTEPARPSATFVTLSGKQETVKRFPDAPIFLQWTQQQTIVFVRHDRLWQARFDRTGMLNDPEPIGSDAALYMSSSRNGTLLFVSEPGLRVRLPDGKEQEARLAHFLHTSSCADRR